MKLDGQQRLQLQQSLLSAFPGKAKLEQMVSFQLEKRLDEIAGGADLTEITFNLIKWAETNGRVDELVTKANTSNPGNPELSAFAAQVSQQWTSNVGIGLSSLPKLIDKVYDVLTSFRAHFQAASALIEIMSDYKYLHDALHELQIHCYDRILQEAKRFPGDDLTRDNLDDHSQTLQSIIDRLRNVARRPTLVNNDTSWIDSLQQARTTLDDAIANNDSKQLNRCLYLINRVLSLRPAEINVRLNSAARNLRLSEIVQALALARDRLLALHLDDDDDVPKFITGVDALISLDHTLSIYTLDHDKWQAIDTELRQIEVDLVLHMDDIKLAWEPLEQTINPILKNSTEVWAQALLETGGKVDSAIAEQDPVQIREQIRRFRRRALERFYLVDMNLKALCDELRTVGQPLAAVTRLL
jgi:hypothetical protein